MKGVLKVPPEIASDEIGSHSIFTLGGEHERSVKRPLPEIASELS
jgi:hypothetical protein